MVGVERDPLHARGPRQEANVDLWAELGRRARLPPHERAAGLVEEGGVGREGDAGRATRRIEQEDVAVRAEGLGRPVVGRPVQSVGQGVGERGRARAPTPKSARRLRRCASRTRLMV